MKPVYRDILRIAVPSIITNITTPLLSLLDVVIVGHLGDALFIAAIAVGGTIFNMLYWLFAFLRMGASGLTAQANGSGDRQALSLVLWRGIAVSVGAALVLILLQHPLCRLSLSIMDVPDGAADYAGLYFRILIWGAPAVLLNYTFTGWLLGRTDARTPMIVSFVINISNILVSVTLVYAFGMKIEGVAIGTLSAQWLGAIYGGMVIAAKYRPGRVSLSRLFETTTLKGYFTVNINIFLRTLCLIGVTVWFTRAGASQGPVILGVNLLLMQFFSLFSYFMDGFAFAGESITGNSLGRGDAAGLREAVRALLRIGGATALLFFVVYFIGGEKFLGMMTDDATVCKAAGEYMAWAWMLPLCGFMAFTWDGIFIGATMTRWMLISMAGAMAAFFAVYFLLSPSLGNHGLWIAFLTYLVVRGVILHIAWSVSPPPCASPRRPRQ